MGQITRSQAEGCADRKRCVHPGRCVFARGRVRPRSRLHPRADGGEFLHTSPSVLSLTRGAIRGPAAPTEERRPEAVDHCGNEGGEAGTRRFAVCWLAGAGPRSADDSSVLLQESMR